MESGGMVSGAGPTVVGVSGDAAFPLPLSFSLPLFAGGAVVGGAVRFAAMVVVVVGAGSGMRKGRTEVGAVVVVVEVGVTGAVVVVVVDDVVVELVGGCTVGSEALITNMPVISGRRSSRA